MRHCGQMCASPQRHCTCAPVWSRLLPKVAALSMRVSNQQVIKMQQDMAKAKATA